MAKQAARDCIQNRYADLTNSIKAASPTVFGNELVQVKMISEDTMDFEGSSNKYDQASKIMGVVSSTVQVDPESINKFIKVLCESNDPGCRKHGEDMKKESTSLSVLTTTSVLLHPIAQWRELHLVVKNWAAWAAATVVWSQWIRRDSSSSHQVRIDVHALSLIAKIYTAVIPMETGLEQVDNPTGLIERAKNVYSALRGHPRGQCSHDLYCITLYYV